MTPHLADTPVLTTNRLTLRAPRLADWDVFLAFSQDDRSRHIRGGEPATLGEAWRAFGHMAGMWALRGFGLFVFCRKGEEAALGVAGPWFPMDWPEREIGWSVWQAEAEGKGLAHEAAAAARDFAFRALGWDTAVSYIAHGNTRSIALAERLGAVRDDTAARPGDKPCHVFRHPKPGART